MAVARSTKPAARRLYAGASIVEGRLTVGASGAVTSWVGYGISGITKHADAGRYIFELADQYTRLVGCSICVLGTLAEYTHMLLSEDVDNPTTASRVVHLQVLRSGSAQNVASGDVILVSFTLQHSNLPLGNTLT